MLSTRSMRQGCGAALAATLLHVDGASVVRGGQSVLRDLRLDVECGEIIVVTGANGSGKTTLLRLIAGLIQPTSGTVVRAAGLRPEGGDIALIAHTAALHPALSLRENLALVERLQGQRVSAVDDVLAEVGLLGVAERPAGSCSAGMRRRTEIARVRLSLPRLLLLDEAHAALDVAARSLVAGLVTDVAADGGAVVMVTHEPEAVAEISGRRVELRHGALQDVSWR